MGTIATNPHQDLKYSPILATTIPSMTLNILSVFPTFAFIVLILYMQNYYLKKRKLMIPFILKTDNRQYYKLYTQLILYHYENKFIV